MAYITIHARFTRDPELTYVTVKGEQKAVCKFSVAEEERFGEGANFYDCQIWGKRAEAVQKFFFKGKDIVLHGHHEQEPYQDKEGKTRRPWKLNVDNFEFCGNKNDNAQAPQTGATPGIPEGFIPQTEDDDDIPF